MYRLRLSISKHPCLQLRSSGVRLSCEWDSYAPSTCCLTALRAAPVLSCCRTALRLCFSRRGLRVSGRTKSWTREPRGRRRAGNRKREGRCIAGLSCLSPMSHTYLLSRMSHTCRVPTGLLPVSSVACLSRNTLLHCPKLNRILQFSPPVGTLSRIARTREWIHVG